MAKILIFIFCVSSWAVVADVFRSVDADGKVTYSDQPHKGSSKIKLPDVMVYSPPALPKRSKTPSPAPEPSSYQRISIVSPQADDTIWDNEGKIVLVVALDPALQLDAGHRILVGVDGKTLGKPRTSTRIPVAGLERGSHTVDVKVIGAKGKTLIAAESVAFHLHRQSRLFPNRIGTPGPVTP